MKSPYLMMFLALLGGCGANISSSRNDLSAATAKNPTPQFSCSHSVQGPNDYNFKVDVYHTTMTIAQSARNARFAMLKYKIVEDQAVVVPSQASEFECSYFKPEANNYSVSIKVFEKVMVVQQSSKNARFAPMKYKITAL